MSKIAHPGPILVFEGLPAERAVEEFASRFVRQEILRRFHKQIRDGMDDRKREFVALLTRNERRLYGYILSLVPDWNNADEILQETNIRLWEEFGRFEQGTDFHAWALRVAYYQVLTWRKNRSRQKLIYDESLLEEIRATQDEMNDLLETRRDALRRCLEQINPESRRLLAQYYGEGLRINEIAASMNRSVQAVYKAVQRIRSSLHGCIERRLRHAE